MNQVYYMQVETKQTKEHLLMIEVLCQSVKIKKITYSEENNIVKAETLKALKVVACDYSFRIVNKDSLIYKEMFPDSKIAASFSQEETKVKYNIRLTLQSHLLRIFVIVHLLSNLMRQPLSK